MDALRSFATTQPVLFVLILTIARFVLLIVFMGIASSPFHQPFDDATTGAIGHLKINF